MTVYEPQEDSFLLQKFVKKYSKGLVLDMGTGSGIQAKTAAEKADLVIGLDIDKDAVKYCEKNIKSQKSKISGNLETSFPSEKNIHFFKSNLFQIFEENFFFYDPIEKRIEVYDKKKVKCQKSKISEHAQKSKGFLTDKEQLRILVKKPIKFDLIIFNPPYLPQELEERDLALEGGKKGYEVLERFLNKVGTYIKQDGRIVILFSSFTNRQRINDCIHKNDLKYIELEKKHIFFEDLYVYYITKK